MIYVIIGYVYKSYTNNHDVLKPFITQVTENKDKVLEQYELFKNSFVIKSEEIEKFENINIALVYLEKARYLDNEAKRYNNMAIEILRKIKKYNFIT
jgi:type IV secretory pathway VirB4 component